MSVETSPKCAHPVCGHLISRRQ